MILVFAGTQDGRELAAYLEQHGYKAAVSVATTYGAELVSESENMAVIQGKLHKEDMLRVFNNMKISAVVDATHPFARNVSENAVHACEHAGIHYLRYERAKGDYKEFENVIVTQSFEDAIDRLNSMNGKIFLTTGSNNLKFVIKEINEKDRLIVRVLPGTEIMSRCMELGLQPKQVIAMQGPFSRELNREMFRQCNTAVVVTKDSGSVGGMENKLLAAQDLNIPIMVIARPNIDYPLIAATFEEVLERVKQWEN
ncbi:precorrin-6A reductase [Petroclostridium sp. X23]|uniref:precorrin-6A reductase n=1 Tax=Petroclostridium sp. X23 TaxID=3045146 RepID=UPI0024AE552C|nr:precorrin-6A reductase [Petroclostridium sp. X23]WHH60582.1 precorrin-6A reductase [Petroclostridium sp. X23]